MSITDLLDSAEFKGTLGSIIVDEEAVVYDTLVDYITQLSLVTPGARNHDRDNVLGAIYGCKEYFKAAGIERKITFADLRKLDEKLSRISRNSVIVAKAYLAMVLLQQIPGAVHRLNAPSEG